MYLISVMLECYKKTSEVVKEITIETGKLMGYTYIYYYLHN